MDDAPGLGFAGRMREGRETGNAASGRRGEGRTGVELEDGVTHPVAPNIYDGVEWGGGGILSPRAAADLDGHRRLRVIG